MLPRTGLVETFLVKNKIRCGLVHDHVLLRQGLRRLLEDEPDIEVVSEAGNAAECLRKIQDLRPDVVVADSATFGLAPPEAERLVAQECPRTKIVFLSPQDEAEDSPLGETRLASASCAVRQTSSDELVMMVRNASSTNQTSHLEVSADGESQSPVPNVGSPRLSPRDRALTAREREVLKLLAEGKTVRAAATVLGLSIKTVDAHKFNLMRKLGIHNKAQLVMCAIQRKVVKVPVNF
ncbi:MAG: two component transcriptional regulator, LuxR family [Candidatus Sulfotelmatobacter sp.]|nr:two component transcriptional regulator, LuxR family [Candidatus Sulfotelmatobacter sp.]